MNIRDAAVCYTTYEKYNNGTQLGIWVDIADFCSKEALFDYLREEFEDESDPEFMLSDYENIPEDFIYGDDIDDNLFTFVNCLEVGNVDLFLEWCEYFGHDLTEDLSNLEKMFEDSYCGNMDMETFAEEYIHSNYDMKEFPDNYIDYEAVMDDLREEFVELDGYIFRYN